MSRLSLATTSTELFKQVRALLPEGGTLSKREWKQRHTAILWVLYLHVVGLFVFSLVSGNGLAHSLGETVVLLPWMFAASSRRVARRARSCAATLGLLTASAVLVHLFNGAIEAHFHFFVMIGVITLYQDWLPFGLALGYVVVHHTVLGLVTLTDVFNHPAALRAPWSGR